MTPSPQADRPLVERWLAELAEQRRQSPHTVAGYRRDLETLLALAEAAGQPALAGLQDHHIRRFVAQLHARGLSGRSLARILSAWRGFYGWLGLHGLAAQNPAAAVRAPKSPKALPRALSPDEANRLLDAPAAASDAEDAGGVDDPLLALRDQAMFELFYSSGLRLSELASLDTGCMADVAGGEIRVLGKRARVRLVPVGRQAQAALAAWMDVRAALAADGEPSLFVGRQGRRLGPRAIQKRLARRAQAAGLPQHVHPHMLRHSFASHVLQSSGDLRAVQEMLGHASIASTQVYTHLDFQHLAQVYDRAHPRARRK